MHIKKNNYDLLYFEPDRQAAVASQRQAHSSLSSDLQSSGLVPSDAEEPLDASTPLHQRIRKALLAWLKPAPSP